MGLLFFVFSLFNYYWFSSSNVFTSSCGDLAAVYYGVDMMKEGKNPYSVKGDYFDTGKEKVEVTYNYLPFYGFLVWFIDLLDFKYVKFLWFLLSTIFAIFSLVFIFKIVHVFKPDLDVTDLFLVSSLFLNSKPFFTGLVSGQNHTLVLMLISGGVYYYLKDKRILSAVFLSLVMLIKVNFVLFLPFFLVRRDFKMVLNLLMSTGIFLLISLLVVKPIFYWNFVEHLLDRIPINKIVFFSPNTQALGGFIMRVFHINEYGSVFNLPLALVKKIVLIANVLILSLSLVGINILRARTSSKAKFVSLFLMVSSVILVAPFSWKHYFTWTFLFFVVSLYVFNPLFKEQQKLFFIMLLGFLIIAVNPLYLFVDFIKDIFGKGFVVYFDMFKKPWAVLFDYDYFYVLLISWIYLLEGIFKRKVDIV